MEDRRITAAGLLAAIITLASCSSSVEHTAEIEAIASGSGSYVSAMMVRRWDLREEYTAKCMLSEGFEYQIEPRQVSSPVNAPEGQTDGWGIARSYFDAIKTQSQSADPQEGDASESTARNERQDWLRTQALKNCSQRADARAIDEVGLSDVSIVMRDWAEQLEGFQSSESFQLESKRWSRCMGSHGFVAESPSDLTESLIATLFNDSPSFEDALNLELAMFEANELCPQPPRFNGFEPSTESKVILDELLSR